ncbi:ABC transporter permease [Roseivirga sp. UBA838]|uniref:ABC transporter permease n=1 Tax=Roseivirga sp. UBA838 TaxID=1947393 RepID=UPI00258088DC|nr:ABC transporter permease [Roseivirga sp. UBA838]
MKNQPPNLYPPSLAIRLLRWFCEPALLEDVEGDLEELFSNRLKNGRRRAKWLFYWDVLLLFRPGIIREIRIFKGQTNHIMFKNYIKIAWRNAMRYKGYTALNLLGLIVGMASSILILLWVQDERNVNAFHTNGDQIYQVFRNMRQSNGQVNTGTSIPKPLGDLVKSEYTEVAEVAWLSWSMPMDIARDNQAIEESGRFASPEVLTMFSFELLLGDSQTALNSPSGLLISERVAEKHFGPNWRNEAMGQVFKVEEQFDVQVTGVFRSPGTESTLDFEWLLPAQAYFAANPWVEDWGNGAFETYLLIPDTDKVQAVADKIRMEIKKHTQGNPNAGDEELIIHRFSDTYLYSAFDNGVVSGGRIEYVRIMTVVAIFILLVACINFMNLTTARSSRRSKEIGLRKVMGAARKSIRTQFYLEAFLLAGCAVAVSAVVVAFLLPLFNELVGKSLVLNFEAPETWFFLMGLIFGVGLLSGTYPALLLPTFNVIQSMKGGVVKQSGFASYFRKGLVVFQFAISTLLIIGTTVIYRQIDFVLNKDLGLNKDNLLAVSLEGDLASRLETYKNELLRLPQVTHVSGASGNPLNYGRSTSSANWEGKNPNEGYEVNVMLTDEHFIETTGMEILAGRSFSSQLQDSTNFIINEVAAELMGFEDPIGKKLSFWGIDGKIVGVVKNFHMKDLYEPIAPLIITCISPSNSSIVLIRTNENTSDALAAIEQVTQSLNPGEDFRYQFIDQAYAESYEAEQTMRTLANLFALVSIVISTLGLLGLASYSAEQRSKEIGVRKVHGASVMQVLLLLSKDYGKLILMAFVLAVPFGYYFMQNWLNQFEFREALNPVVFLFAGVIVMSIGVLTVAAKSYQAASVNPVKSLKEE